MQVQHRKPCGSAQFLVAAIALLALAFPFSLVVAQPIRSILSNMPIISEASAPAGTEGLAVQWFNVASPELREHLIAVAHQPVLAHSRLFFFCMEATASPKNTCV